MNIAIVGATGLVGRKMLQVLAERKFSYDELYLVASRKSAGSVIDFAGTQYTVITVEEALKKDIDIALFSAGASVSKQYAPLFADKGTYVVDNSSAWRMDKTKKLVVPEINGNVLTAEDRIIANPNCSTIQMLMAIYPIYKEFGIKRIVVSTYQSVTGSGKKAVDQLIYERSGFDAEKKYPHKIDMNVLPHCDVFVEDDYTTEEMKLVNETHKIFDDYSIAVNATAVRVPVVGGHSESVYLELDKKVDLDRIKKLISEFPGVVLYDEPDNDKYPMPIVSYDHDEVFVGRIRRDLFSDNAMTMWVVADNLRKGAATNAVQIAELIKVKFLTKKN